MLYRYSGTIPSEISSICSYTLRIVHEIDRHLSMDRSSLQDIRLVISELMINACEHGNRNNPDKIVSIDVAADDEAISISVKDEGSGVNWDGPCFAKKMKASGRGLMIVDALVEELTLNKSEVHCIYKFHHL